MLYIILAIILIIALLLIIQLSAFSTVYISYKDKLLVVRIQTPFYRKEIKYDLAEKKEEVKTEGVAGAEKSEKSFISSKTDEIKKRIFNPETGFDAEELKNVWDEICETYSYGMGIIKKLLGKMRHKIHITNLFVKLEYGTNNPAATGIIYGSAWGLVGTAYPILTRYFHIVYPTLDITPDFYGERFDIEVRSIIKVRAAHIIRAALSSLFVPAVTYFKDKISKGSEKNGR